MSKSKLNVGVIGSGAISNIYIENMINKFDNLEVLAVASKNFENAEKKAKEFNIEAKTTEELINDANIDLIVNLTPVGAHYELIKKSLLAGKHVYTEKTITQNLAEAKELLEIANEKNLFLGSAPDTFMGGAFQSARSAIDSGILGEVNSFAISCNRDNALLQSMFAFLLEPGAGVLKDYAVYHLTALVSLLGSVERVGGVIKTPYKKFTNILPTSPNFGKELDSPNESRVSAILMMKSGVTGTLHIDSDNIIQDQTYFAIYGTKGILYLTDPNGFGGTVKFIPKSIDFTKPVEFLELECKTGFVENSRGIGPSDLAESVLKGKRSNRASKEMAYHVLEVLEGILSCGENGAFIDIKSDFEMPEPMPVLK